MSIVLYHHSHTRSANVVWMLEELGLDYTLQHVKLSAGEHKSPAMLALNPMGKLPILVDGDVVVTESAAIALYLADRYGSGTLAPAFDDPARGAYLRWSLFAPSVIEPGSMAKAGGWESREGAVGWGNHAAMLEAMAQAIGAGPYLLGERFSMADVVFGGTLRFMLAFNMLEQRPIFVDYVARLNARPANIAAKARNEAELAAHPD